MRRRYYGEHLADGTGPAYPPTPSQEQQWQDGVDYNSVPSGTVQYVDPAGNRGPVQTTYQKATPPLMGGPGKSGRMKPLPQDRLVRNEVIQGTQPVQQLARTVERIK